MNAPKSTTTTPEDLNEEIEEIGIEKETGKDENIDQGLETEKEDGIEIEETEILNDDAGDLVLVHLLPMVTTGYPLYRQYQLLALGQEKEKEDIVIVVGIGNAVDAVAQDQEAEKSYQLTCANRNFRYGICLHLDTKE